MVTICTINPDGANAPVTSLQAYIEHKIGSPLEAIDADSHERFLVIEAEALRDIYWFRQTWPSEKDKYAEQYKKLVADPEAKAEAAALLKAAKKRK